MYPFWCKDDWETDKPDMSILDYDMYIASLVALMKSEDTVKSGTFFIKADGKPLNIFSRA